MAQMIDHKKKETTAYVDWNPGLSLGHAQKHVNWVKPVNGIPYKVNWLFSMNVTGNIFRIIY